MADILSPAPVLQYTAVINGVFQPASGYRLFFYSAGTTSPITIYQNSAGTTLNNPVTLNANGYPTYGGAVVAIYVPAGTAYKIVLAPPGSDSPPATTVWTADNIVQPIAYTTTLSTNQLLYATSSNTIGTISLVDNAMLVSNASGVPSWTTSIPAALQTTITETGTITTGTWNSTLGSTAQSGIVTTGTITSGTWNSTLGSAAQSGITQTGTITSGTWNGTTIATAHGGTGLTSFTSNGIVYASSSSALSQTTSVDNGVVTTSASGVPQVLANGTAGYVLTAQSGAPPQWVASPTGTWSPIATQTASSSSAITFSSIPSGYTAFKIVCQNVSPADTSGDTLNVTMNSAISGYEYSYIYSSAGGTVTPGGSASATAIQLLPSVDYNTGGAFLTIDVYNPVSGSLAAALSYTGIYPYYSTHSRTCISGGGTGGVAGVVTSITFNFTSAAIASGVFSLYGLLT